MTKFVIISCLLALSVLFATAQNDPLYNQYLMNQSMINPAYNGVNDMGNITAITRGQWVGVEGAPFTHTFSAASTFSDHSAAGLLFVKDSYGINSTTDVMFSYAYRIHMLDSYLSFGLQGGFSSYVKDFTKIDTEVSDDPLIGTGRHSQSGNNFGFGLMYKSDVFYLGVASPRMLETVIEEDGIVVNSYKPTYNMTGGFLITPIDFVKIKPSFLIRYSDNEISFDLNGQLLISDAIWLGVTSRNLNSGGVNIIYTSDGIYHFGYSFEFPFNEIGGSGYGTHEVMISIDMKLSSRHQQKERFF